MTREQLNEAVALAKKIDDYKRILKKLNDGPLRLQCCDVTITVPEDERGFIFETIERQIKILENTFDML